MPIQSERRQEITHDNLKRTKGGEGERPDGFRCEKRGCKHLSFPGPRTKTTSQPMWSPIPPSAGADRTGTASQPPSPSTHKCKWDAPNAFGEQPEYRGPLHRHHNTHLLFALENGTRVKNNSKNHATSVRRTWTAELVLHFSLLARLMEAHHSAGWLAKMLI